jgi:hypothetical protein
MTRKYTFRKVCGVPSVAAAFQSAWSRTATR